MAQEQEGFNQIDGTDGRDTLNGTEGSDQISGFGEDDFLYGEGGDDVLDGGQGVDLLDAGAGNDTVVGGLGNDLGIGGEGDDYIVGGDGTDALDGGGGDDTVDGGEGEDIIEDNDPGLDIFTGGAQSDIFIFAGVFGNNIITDFDETQDAIIFKNASQPDVTVQEFSNGTVLSVDNAVSKGSVLLPGVTDLDIDDLGGLGGLFDEFNV